MKQSTIEKKVVVILIVSLLAISFNLSITVLSDNVQNNDDGTWYDNFGDDTGIESSENIDVTGGYIKLSKGNNYNVYDFNDEDENNRDIHNAYYHDKGKISSGEGYLDVRNLLGETPFGSDVKGIVKLDDGEVKLTRSWTKIYTFLPKKTYSAIHHFRFKIDENKDNIKELDFSWWYGEYDPDANIDNLVLYVWHYSILSDYIDGLGRWVKEDSVTYKSSNINKVDGKPDIFFNTNSDEYISDEGYIDFLVVANPKDNDKNCLLTTDYVNLSVSSKFGYLDEGYIISGVISPSQLNSWESIIWDSSRESKTTSVKIQILEDNGDLVSNSDLSGNSKGFTFEDSPLDISLLSTSINAIRLKATLYSDSIDYTPRLYEWGVTWQTGNKKYSDSFSTDLRLDSITGANIDNEKIEMSNFYSDWPMIGKDPENTRAYGGIGPDAAKFYYNTKREAEGGGYRSPIISDGLMYIASITSGKIYVYNATVPSDEMGKELDYWYSSNAGYTVDSSVAVTDNFVIVANGETGKSNKVYALYKNNLSEAWNYAYEDGNICFSSAPTIANGKVFVTSWSGNVDELTGQSIIDFVMALINGNNRIIVIDLASGAEIWNAKLPAGSFSTPAISDGMVFVASNNLLLDGGNNLYAFDEDTGEEIWKANVGLMGCASPVAYEDKVFVVVKEQSLKSLKGDVKLVALDKSSGDMLWNQTISENVGSVLDVLPNGFKIFYPMSTSTPAVYEDRIYVTSPDSKLFSINAKNGDVVWSTSLPDTAAVTGYNCISPVVAYDKVYVAAPMGKLTGSNLGKNGIVYAFSTSDASNDKEPLWEHVINSDENVEGDTNYIIAPPVVSDGILYVSTTNDLVKQNGRVYAIGNYTQNQKAKVVSSPIHLPGGQWWSTFTAECDDNDENTIKFSILDKDNKVLETDLNKTDHKISHINNGIIKLQAMFNIGNSSKDSPVLHSWSVNWTTNNNLPQFVDSSFKPDPSGWINTNTPICSIQVYDDMPGLDINSTYYKVTYVDKDDKTIESDWISANCTGEDGTTDKETIEIDISDASFADEIKDLESISIKISDLAGYMAQITKGFSKDTKEPTSYIKDKNSFDDEYNDEFNITASASDASSGIKHVILKYKYSSDGEDWDEWDDFGDPRTPATYSWLFGTTKSGYYKVVTIAEDKAGNIEDIDDKDEDDMVTFLFDMKKPSKPIFETDEYTGKTAPEFTIDFNDDYILVSVEYLILGVHGINEWQNLSDDINKPGYTDILSLSEYWDDLEDGKIYYVYFRLVDIAGNVYETGKNSDAIKVTKDTEAGISYVDTSDFADQFDDKFTITVSIPDEDDIDTVTLYYRYSEDNETWDEWSQYGETLSGSPFEWNFTAENGDGYYKFKSAVKDVAGNVQESATESVKVSIFPMMEVGIIIVIIACILIAGAVLIIRRRKMEKF